MHRFLAGMQLHGVGMFAEWIKQMKETREKAARLINATPDEVAFVRNTVEVISIVAEGLPWREGDNVVTVNGEYLANVHPWLNLKSRAGIFGFGATLDVLQEAGIANIERHVWGLLDFAVDGLRAKGREILSSLTHGERSGMISFRIPRIPTPDLVARLGEAKVSITARSGGIRVAPHLYNNREDIGRLLYVVPGAIVGIL